MMTGWQIAVLIGLALAACMSAATVLMAFTRHGKRCAIDAFHRHVPSYADRLSAGICMTATGSIMAGMAVVVYFVFNFVSAPLLFIGWALIGVGYFFQFGAWHAATIGRFAWFRWAWGAVLVVIAAGAAIIFIP